MEEKVFKTYEEQIKILEDRGLNVNTKDIIIFKKENYYNIINGYKDLFLNSSSDVETYKDGSNFLEIFALYEFDRELRFIFLKRLLKIETHIKSIISYEFSKKYGHDNYLKLENFEPYNKKNKNLQNVMKVISTIQRSTTDQSGKHNAITHYMMEYGYVPLWVLANVLTFGVISRFFGIFLV